MRITEAKFLELFMLGCSFCCLRLLETLFAFQKMNYNEWDINKKKIQSVMYQREEQNYIEDIY